MSMLLQESSAMRERLMHLLAGVLPEAWVGTGVVIGMSLLKATAIVLVIQIGMLYATWLERKLIGRMQDRLGPNRIGKFGLLVPFADMIKILTKEDITPRDAHSWVYNLGAILILPPALVGFAVVAFSSTLIAADLSVGLLFFFAIASTAVIPIFMAGWGSRNKFALIGAMRAVAQIVSYEIPQVLSLVGVLLLAGTLSMNQLVGSQGPLPAPGAEGAVLPGVWYIFLQPIAFVIFLLATTAEIERTPFDLPEAESEIIAGYHTEYSGIKFGMFYLALYFATIAAAAVTAMIFLGGWQPPVPAFLIPESGPITDFMYNSGWLWMTIKTVFLVMVFMWFRGTLPRLRADQMMAFCWKILVPLSLANLLVTGLLANLLAPLASPMAYLGAFVVANAILLGITLWAVRRWRERGSSGDFVFEVQPAAAPSGVGGGD